MDVMDLSADVGLDTALLWLNDNDEKVVTVVPPTVDVEVYHYNMKKVAPYCVECGGSFNFLLLGAPTKKAAESKERAVLLFVWDRDNTLLSYLRSNGGVDAPANELDQVLVSGLSSGALLAFGSASSASDLIYGNASNGAVCFTPTVNGANGLFGSVTDFLRRFARTSAFFADATKKPHCSSPGWSIGLNGYTYAKFRSVLNLDANVCVGRKPTTKAAATKVEEQDDVSSSSPTKKARVVKKKNNDVPKKKNAAVAEQVPVPSPAKKARKVGVDANTEKKLLGVLAATAPPPYTRMYGDSYPSYQWPDRGTSLFPDYLTVARDAPPTLMYYDRVEHDRVVAEWVRLNALSETPKPVHEVELDATRWLLHSWTAFPCTSEWQNYWSTHFNGFAKERPDKK